MRIRGKTLFFTALPVSLALMLSCSGLLDLEVPKGTLVLELNSSVASRTIEPALDLSVEKYDISGTGPGGAVFSASDIVGPSYAKSQLIAGEWTIVATGKNSGGKAIVRGQVDKVKVEARNTVTKSIACTPIAGNGTLSLSLSWPSGSIAVPGIVATLTPKGGLVQSISLPISGTSASYTNNALSNGFYTLNIKLRDNYDTGKLCWSLVSSVLILAGETTSGSWSLQEGDLALFPFGGVSLTLSSDSRKPIPLSLTGLASELVSGQTMTVTAGGAPAGSTYRWYLNGDLVAGESSASATIGNSLSEGTHWLYCVAEAGEVAGSAGSLFRVKAAALPRSGLVAEYLFEGNANDSSGHSYDGTIASGIVAGTEDRFGSAGKAFNFDANEDNGFKILNPSAAMASATSSTISFWIKRHEPTGGYVIYNYYGGGGHIGQFYVIMQASLDGFSDGVLLVCYQTEPEDASAAASNQLSFDSRLGTGSWHNVTIVFDNTAAQASDSISLFVDGVEVASYLKSSGATTNVNILDWNDNIRVGAAVNADLDDIRIYNRALYGSEIQDLYSEGGWTGNPSTLSMVAIPGGSFNNGASAVTLTPFRMSKYEITQGQYVKAMGSNPSYYIGENKPVETLTWFDAVEYCNSLSQIEGRRGVYTIGGRTPATGHPITAATVAADLSKSGYRLPSEAQWEYAARAGTASAYYWGDATDPTTVGQYAWYSDSSGLVPHEVGLKSANSFGLFDMAGNVIEWCYDWNGSYPVESQIDPIGAGSGTQRIARGGNFAGGLAHLRSDNRGATEPSNAVSGIGFRVVLPAE